MSVNLSFLDLTNEQHDEPMGAPADRATIRWLGGKTRLSSLEDWRYLIGLRK
jgi:hypothetical protein